MNWRTLKTQLQSVLDSAVENGEECGLGLAIFDHGDLVIDIRSGFSDLKRTNPVKQNTLFPFFSVGKGIMATAFHRLVEEQKINYDTAISDVWPEFSIHGKKDIRVWQILSHRAGLFRLPCEGTNSILGNWQEMCKKLENATPATAPGGPCRYHGITFAWLVGETARRASGEYFRDTITNKVLKPLKLENDIFFGTDASSDNRVAEIDASSMAPELAAWYTGFIGNPDIRHGFVPSGNGVGTAYGIAKHYASLLSPVEGIQLLQPQTLERATTLCRAIDDPIKPGDWTKFGLGYALAGTDDNLGVRFGHGGAAGAEGFADKERQLAVGFVKNIVPATHPIHPVRDRISTLLKLPYRHW